MCRHRHGRHTQEASAIEIEVFAHFSSWRWSWFSNEAQCRHRVFIKRRR
jgi:hypothetical protein